MPEHDADRPVPWHDAAEFRDRLHPPVHLPAAVLQHGELEAHLTHILRIGKPALLLGVILFFP